MEKLKVPEIWKILNKATRGHMAVYDLACAMYGLEEDTIRDIADKIHNDLYLDKWDWRKHAKEIIKNKQAEKKWRKIHEH